MRNSSAFGWIRFRSREQLQEGGGESEAVISTPLGTTTTAAAAEMQEQSWFYATRKCWDTGKEDGFFYNKRAAQLLRTSDISLELKTTMHLNFHISAGFTHLFIKYYFFIFYPVCTGVFSWYKMVFLHFSCSSSSSLLTLSTASSYRETISRANLLWHSGSCLPFLTFF